MMADRSAYRLHQGMNVCVDATARTGCVSFGTPARIGHVRLPDGARKEMMNLTEFDNDVATPVEKFILGVNCALIFGAAATFIVGVCVMSGNGSNKDAASWVLGLTCFGLVVAFLIGAIISILVMTRGKTRVAQAQARHDAVDRLSAEYGFPVPYRAIERLSEKHIMNKRRVSRLWLVRFPSIHPVTDMPQDYAARLRTDGAVEILEAVRDADDWHPVSPLVSA